MEFVDKKMSLLYPKGESNGFRVMSEITMHDLGFDTICEAVADKKDTQQAMIMRVLSKMTDDPYVARYRSDIFEDIYKNPDMCKRMMEILDKINFLRDYGSFKKKYEEASGIWELMHRLEEINEYIGYVEAIYQCLSTADIQSEGLLGLREYINEIYHDNGFEALKKDISKLKSSTQDLKSVTVGINLNERFETDSIGLISINNKYFTKSNVIGNFYDKIASKSPIKDGTTWDGSYKFHPINPVKEDFQNALEKSVMVSVASQNPLLVGQLAAVPAGDAAEDVTRYMDRVTNHMLSLVVKNLRDTLNKYVSISITEITNLIPEFSYYIRFAEYIKKLEKHGLKFCKPQIADEKEPDCMMRARGIYNMKLASVAISEQTEIITNDLDYDKEHLVYILTGANRGGKTTITQAIGQLFVLAQGGIRIPGESFLFQPVDAVYTHFPADEDKTMDLGRLGEECKRFKELYFAATENSLLLLNETFSTTSFEEGYFIAKDAVRAVLHKGIRTLYNTHMHKLAFDIDSFNEEDTKGKAVSLIVKAKTGQRSFKVEIAPPEGMSYAKDIAEKYGVTYEMLMEEK
ncbi:MAG: DNA mismatch repair protein [Lachnospiraceae bacterium]|nr:DNA mismatch repair protein [Lachnospiraceae bacterium]